MANLNLFGQTLSNVTAFELPTTGGSTATYTEGGITPSGTKSISISSNGTTTEDVTNYASAEITVNVPTGTARSSSDLTVSGATVTAPAGLYASNATYTMPSAGLDFVELNGNYTTQNNQRKWVATISAEYYEDGYISDGYHYLGSETFEAVPSNTTITPSTSSQTIGGQNYMMEGAVTVAAMPSGTAGTPTATKGAVSNHSVSVTPSVTNTTGYITGSTKTGTAVTVSASELVSGSETKTANGTYDVTNLSSLVVAVPFSTIYSGSSAPSSSLGSNGDIYLQTGS